MARKDVNITVTMNTNTIFIGDICYALDNEIYQEKWGKGLNWADGEIRAEDGSVCAVVGSTAYGDGCYEGSDGTEFCVDAGVIGVTDIANFSNGGNFKDLEELGKIVNIPEGECFVTLIDEQGSFYIVIEDMKHNRIYSVHINTLAEEKIYCQSCGEEISDSEYRRYGGYCESCYETSMYEPDEEDLYESCDASCTSAEFQRMAPGRNAKIIGMRKRSLGKKNKYNTLGEKKNRRISEAFTDEELDMDDDEWIEKMKAQRAAEKQARQIRRDAEEKAKRDAEEKEARLARGEYTEEEKKKNIGHNFDLLADYIQTMKKDLQAAFAEAASPLSIGFDNPIGYQPYTSQYATETFPMYVNVSAERSDEDVVEYLSGDFDFYNDTCVYYPVITLEDLKSNYLGDLQEADRFHSGKRNEEGFKKYFVEGTAVFNDIDEIHDTLDSDAELFATIKWMMYESFGVLVAAAAKAKSRTIEGAVEKFATTKYAAEAGFNMSKDKFFFIQYAGAFYSEEEVEHFMESATRKVSKKNLRENASAQDKVLVRVHVPSDYYDEYGNPANAEKYDERLEEIDKVLFEAGAETVWEVASDPEAGWEGDDFFDTGFRRMTIAQLQVAIENGGIEEDEIRVYDNNIDVSQDQWSDYMNKHPEINPYDSTVDYDIYENHRIHDVYSLVFDADDRNPTERPLLQRMLQDGYTEADAKDMAEYTGLDVSDPIGFNDFVKLRDDWLVWTGKAGK